VQTFHLFLKYKIQCFKIIACYQTKKQHIKGVPSKFSNSRDGVYWQYMQLYSGGVLMQLRPKISEIIKQSEDITGAKFSAGLILAPS